MLLALDGVISKVRFPNISITGQYPNLIATFVTNGIMV